MMRILIIVVLVLASEFAFGQLKIDNVKYENLLKNQEYRKVFNDASAMRKQEYGKCATVDYLICRSLCGLGLKEASGKWYNNMLKNYPLKADCRKSIEKEKNSCTETGPAIASHNHTDLNTFLAISSIPAPESGVRGKGGLISFEGCGLPPQIFQNTSVVSESEMASRLFYLNEGTTAVSKIKELMGPKYQVQISGRFVVVSYDDTELTAAEITSVSSLLQQTFDFYVDHYKIRPPDKLLTVFLLPNKYQLRIAAKKYHGIIIPDANIGYSNIGDLSLLGVADPRFMGTMMHELFHLMVRTDVGDAPPWLDEGIACVYEESAWDGKLLKGTTLNWRVKQLGDIFENPELNAKVPSLRNFLESSWDEFDGIKQNDKCVGAINYAYGRALMVYLQQQEKLSQIFGAMKDRCTLHRDGQVEIRSSLQVIESAMGKSVEQLETDFRSWLDQALSKSRSSQPFESNMGQQVQKPVFKKG